MYGQPPPPPFAAVVSHLPVSQYWSSGLCDCFVDIPICCLACWCPCITFGQIAEILDKGETSCGVHGTTYALINVLTGCGCLHSCSYRTYMRGLYGLPEVPANDCCVHFWCEPCALSQEYRELRGMGFDLSMGWQGNLARWPSNHGVQMAPTAPGGMYR